MLGQDGRRPVDGREDAAPFALRESFDLRIKKRRLSHGLAWLRLNLWQRRSQWFLDMYLGRLDGLLLLLHGLGLLLVLMMMLLLLLLIVLLPLLLLMLLLMLRQRRALHRVMLWRGRGHVRHRLRGDLRCTRLRR
jgi:hypothetical protein